MDKENYESSEWTKMAGQYNQKELKSSNACV